MSFLLQCQNKDCKKVTEVVVDKNTRSVHCGDCDEKMTNVTDFVKQSLFGMKKFRTPKKSVSSYSLECNACHKKMTPLLVKGELHCPECREPHQVTSHFKNMFISNFNSK